jgi:hypothetical protein
VPKRDQRNEGTRSSARSSSAKAQKKATLRSDTVRDPVKDELSSGVRDAIAGNEQRVAMTYQIAFNISRVSRPPPVKDPPPPPVLTPLISAQLTVRQERGRFVVEQDDYARFMDDLTRVISAKPELPAAPKPRAGAQRGKKVR